jgi:hypothetical protein
VSRYADSQFGGSMNMKITPWPSDPTEFLTFGNELDFLDLACFET